MTSAQRVTVQRLALTTIPLKVTSYGQVVSPTSVTLSAQTNGVIAAIYFTPGAHVRAGQILLTLRSNDSSAQVAQLEAQAEYAREYYVRNQALKKIDPGAISEMDVLQARSNYLQAKAQYQEASQIETIRAPIAGLISDTDVSVGDFVTQGQTLASIVSHDMQVKYSLAGSIADKAKRGQTIVFRDTDTHKIYVGVVVYVAPQLSTLDYTRTLRANLHATTPPLLNSFGQVDQVLDPTHQVLAVPQNLVQNDSQGFYVDLVKDHQVAQQYFTPGQLTHNGLITAVSGLKPGMQLITSDPSALEVNQTVQVASS
jgi:membrane fusion protein (multidrug efflux system)